MEERELVALEVGLEAGKPLLPGANADPELCREREQPLVRLVERLAARVEREALDVEPPRAPAEVAASLENDDVDSGGDEAVRGRQAGEPTSDDEDALVYQTPPSATVIASAFTPLAASLARKTITAAISSGSRTRPAG